MVLPIECHCFSHVYPCACDQPGSCPTFLFPTSRSNLSSTKACQNCFKTYSLEFLALSLDSAFGEILPVFFPCYLRNSVRLSSNHLPQEQLPKHHLIDSTRSARAVMLPRVALATTGPTEPSRQTHSTPIVSQIYMSTP